MMYTIEEKNQGFVLPTSLVLMLLMTVLSIGVYYGVSVSQNTSASAKSSTEAFYYAETGANYMYWALKNDAEFDSYTYPQFVDTVAAGGSNRYSFGEPESRPARVWSDPYTALSDPYAVGDYTEWKANKGNPSAQDAVTGAFDGMPHFGQLMYFDNSPVASRPVCHPAWRCGGAPVLDGININAPRYLRLDIDSDGQVTPALPPYNANGGTSANGKIIHHGSVVGVDIPLNGAIVWLTGGDDLADRALTPIDKYFAPFQDGNGNAIVTSNAQILQRALGTRNSAGNYLYGAGGIMIPLEVSSTKQFDDPLDGNYPTNYQTINNQCRIFDQDVNLQPSGVHPDLLIACGDMLIDSYTQTVTPGWLQSSKYGLVVYAVGYADGKAKKLLRIVLPL